MAAMHCGAGFADVDGSGEAQRFADYLRALSATPSVEEFKRTAIAALGLAPGSRVLDIGCGTGDDVRAMAAIVGPAGGAVGLDASATFIEQARAQALADGPSATFVQADAHELPFADASFQAVRAERTLQHLRDPARAIAEMVRVTAPHGVITIAEPDWDTFVIDVEPLDVARRVQRAFRDGIRQPTVGRSLRRMMVDAGLQDISVEGLTSLFTDASEARHLLDLDATVERLVEAGELAAPEGRDWLERLGRLGERGAFFAAATGFFAIARAPLAA